MKKLWKIECGSVKWKGRATGRKAAVTAAFAKGPPKHLSMLCRIHDGSVWRYWDCREALKEAGYRVRVVPAGGILVQ